MISETKLTVRYQETDQMGIVHHSVYPIWFECGRTDYIRCWDDIWADGKGWYKVAAFKHEVPVSLSILL